MPLLRILMMADLRGIPRRWFIWGLPAALSRLYILIAELRISYVSRFGLSSHSASTAYIDDGRAKEHPTYVVWGFPAAEPLLCILVAELRPSYVGTLGPSSRRALSVYTEADLLESYVSRFGLVSCVASTAHIDDDRA